MGFQVALESENFSHSRITAGREFRWMEQQQKKCDGPVQCVCEERRVSERQKSAEPEVVHASVPARGDMLEWLWSVPCE